MVMADKAEYMKSEFACMAEAVAYFYNRGYTALPDATGYDYDGSVWRRVMIKDGADQLLAPMIELTKEGFLLVVARQIP